MLDVVKSTYEVLYWLYLKITITVMITEDTVGNLMASCRQKQSCFLSAPSWSFSSSWESNAQSRRPLLKGKGIILTLFPVLLIRPFVKPSNASLCRPWTKEYDKLEFWRILKRFLSSPLRLFVLKAEQSDIRREKQILYSGSCCYFQ